MLVHGARKELIKQHLWHIGVLIRAQISAHRDKFHEKDPMTISTTVLSALSKIGSISDIDEIRRGSASQFTPDKYPLSNAPSNATCFVSFLTHRDVPIIRLHVRGTGVCTNQDLDSVIKIVADNNQRALFGAAHVDTWSGKRIAEYHLSVKHAIPIRGLHETTITDVVHEMLRVWQLCMSGISQYLESNQKELPNLSNDNKSKDVGQILGDQNSHIGSGSAFAEINSLVGLQSVKVFAQSLVDHRQLDQIRMGFGVKRNFEVPHLVFIGDPGTGKTTVARKIGKLYQEIGLLTTGHVVEAERGALVGAYLGQTAIKTKELCTQALGGILFIDEAYSLAVDGRDYGHEALETLMTFMENHRNHFAVIIAGYSRQMEKLLSSNPGLRSRFNQTLHFENYTEHELLTMFIEQIESREYVVTESAISDVRCKITTDISSGEKINARTIRNLLDDVLKKHSSLVINLRKPSLRQISTITSLSIPDAWADSRRYEELDVHHLFNEESG